MAGLNVAVKLPVVEGSDAFPPAERERLALTPVPVEIEKSSTPKPSSEPAALKSFQRIKKLAPFAIDKPEIVKEMIVRLGAAFPSNAPRVPDCTGATKSNELTSVHVPVVKLVASKLY